MTNFEMNANRIKKTATVKQKIVTLLVSLFLLTTTFAATTGLSVGATQPKASTLKSASYGLMKEFMEKYNANGFAKVVSIGDISIYKKALLNVKIQVNPKLKSLALYDPKNEILVLSKNPLTVKKSERLNLGNSVWHEVTHRIEDEHGDIGYFDGKLYAERNTEYMTYVANAALPYLELLEKNAKGKTDVATMKKMWAAFVKKVNGTSALPEVKKYPPNAKTLKDWFGFKFNVNDIRKLYESGKCGIKLQSVFKANQNANPQVKPNSSKVYNLSSFDVVDDRPAKDYWDANPWLQANEKMSDGSGQSTVNSVNVKNIVFNHTWSVPKTITPGQKVNVPLSVKLSGGEVSYGGIGAWTGLEVWSSPNGKDWSQVYIERGDPSINVNTEGTTGVSSMTSTFTAPTTAYMMIKIEICAGIYRNIGQYLFALK
jgi:hypothetical protein